MVLRAAIPPGDEQFESGASFEYAAELLGEITHGATGAMHVALAMDADLLA